MPSLIELEESPPPYSHRYIVGKDSNYCIHEIIRGEEAPFTILLMDYKTSGQIQLFADLFFSSDWDPLRSSNGYLSHDMQFTMALYKHLEMDEKHGPFNFNKIIEEYGFKNGDLRRPLVYRASADSIVDRLFNLQSI